jgi:hypothetical protein
MLHMVGTLISTCFLCVVFWFVYTLSVLVDTCMVDVYIPLDVRVAATWFNVRIHLTIPCIPYSFVMMYTLLVIRVCMLRAHC